MRSQDLRDALTAAPATLWALVLGFATGVAAWVHADPVTAAAHRGATWALAATTVAHAVATWGGTPRAVRGGGLATLALALVAALGLGTASTALLLHVSLALLLGTTAMYLHVARRQGRRLWGRPRHGLVAGSLTAIFAFLPALAVGAALAGLALVGTVAVGRPWSPRRALMAATLAYSAGLVAVLGTDAWMWMVWLPLWTVLALVLVLAVRRGSRLDHALTPVVAGVAFSVAAVLASHLEVRAFASQGGVFWALGVAMLGSVALFLMGYDRSKRPAAEAD